MSSSCSVCYEDFTWGGGGQLTTPRTLPCGCVACTGCLRDACDNDTSTLVCPSCLSSHVLEGGKVEDAFPILPSSTAKEERVEEEGNDAMPPLSLASQSSSSSSSSNKNNDRRQSSSSLAAFLHNNPSSSSIAAAAAAASSHTIIQCAVRGCRRQRTESGGERGEEWYCPGHTLEPPTASHPMHKAYRFLKTEKYKLSHLSFRQVVPESEAGGGCEGEGSGTRLRVAEGIEWDGWDPDALASRFKRRETLDLGEVVQLLDAAEAAFGEEANILDIEASVVCVGDLHGQFYDLLGLMEKADKEIEGEIGTKNRYLFLGDYVDRGEFSCEVLLYLLALKVAYPKRIYLLRGNHETRTATSYFGFKEECKAKYGLCVYYNFLRVFQSLPLCALIHTDLGDVFACHGGISPHIQTLQDISNIDRYVEPGPSGSLCDLLWSDPWHEGKGGGGRDDGCRRPNHKNEETTANALRRGFKQEEGKELVDWRPNDERGCSVYFGHGAIKRFLETNNLRCLVRAHQVQQKGYGKHFGKKDEKDGIFFTLTSSWLPPVLTVFSAPNYCGRHGNSAAYLRISKLYVELKQSECMEVPPPPPSSITYLPAFQAHEQFILQNCPYMPTSFRELLYVSSILDSLPPPPSSLASPPFTPPKEGNPHIPPPLSQHKEEEKGGKLTKDRSLDSLQQSTSMTTYASSNSSLVLEKEGGGKEEEEEGRERTDSAESTTTTLTSKSSCSTAGGGSSSGGISPPSSSSPSSTPEKGEDKEGDGGHVGGHVAKLVARFENKTRQQQQQHVLITDTEKGRRGGLKRSNNRADEIKTTTTTKAETAAAAATTCSFSSPPPSAPLSTSCSLSPTPSNMVGCFTTEEIISLRLLFSLMGDKCDLKGRYKGDKCNYPLDKEELLRFAEETGEGASSSQVEECIRRLDVKEVGGISLYALTCMAWRLKQLHVQGEFSLVGCELRRQG